MLHQKMGQNEREILESEAIENHRQDGEHEQANTIKANIGQLYDQENLNEYCQEQVGLASVPESFKSADENDSWQL